MIMSQCNNPSAAKAGNKFENITGVADILLGILRGSGHFQPIKVQYSRIDRSFVIPGSLDISVLRLKYSVNRKYNNPPTSSIFSKKRPGDNPPEEKNLVNIVKITKNVFQTNFKIATYSFADM